MCRVLTPVHQSNLTDQPALIHHVYSIVAAFPPCSEKKKKKHIFQNPESQIKTQVWVTIRVYLSKWEINCMLIYWMKSRKARDRKPNTWRWELMLAYCSDEVLFLYWSVSGISHQQRDGEKREKTCNDFMCVGPGVSNNSFIQPY